MEQQGLFSSIKTTLHGGGRSVMGNTTIGLCAATVMGAGVAIAFIVAGHPVYALMGFALPFPPYFLFFFGTLRHVAKHPDAAVTSEESYAQVVSLRMMAAKDTAIVRAEAPVLGAPEKMIAASKIRSSGGSDA